MKKETAKSVLIRMRTLSYKYRKMLNSSRASALKAAEIRKEVNRLYSRIPAENRTLFKNELESIINRMQ